MEPFLLDTVFRCSGCGEWLWSIRPDFKLTDPLKPSDFRMRRPDVPVPTETDECRCPLCGYWFRPEDFTAHIPKRP